jgi:chemotaxis protein histidine kinase CheA
MTEALGGTVKFESEKGQGTSFIINLPQTSDVDNVFKNEKVKS